MNRESWEVKKIKDLGNIVTGNTPKTSDSQNYDSKDICFIKPSDLSDKNITILVSSENYISEHARVSARILPIGSVLVTCIGIIGKIGILEVEAATNQQINSITPLTQYNSKFIAYNLSSIKDKLNHIANAPVVPIINKTQFSDIELPIPSLPIQEKIVKELDTLHDILAKKKEQLKELDKLAQATFYDMFGDPVENEKGWDKIKLSELVTKLGDGIHGTPKYTDDGEYYFINGNNLKDGKIVITPSTKRISKEEYNIHKVNLTENTLFVSINGTIGNLAFYNGENIMLGKSACYFNLKSDINKIFIYSILKTDYFLNYAMEESTGSTIRNVSLKTMRNFPVILPSLDIQNQFAAKIEAIEKQKELINQSIKDLEQLIGYTMDKYFN